MEAHLTCTCTLPEYREPLQVHVTDFAHASGKSFIINVTRTHSYTPLTTLLALTSFQAHAV